MKQAIILLICLVGLANPLFIHAKQKMKKTASAVQQLPPMSNVQARNALAVTTVARSFSDAWSISKELYDTILSMLPAGSTILELGSGWGTGELAKQYIMYSVENDTSWLNKYNSHYIYAPIVNGWYDIAVLKRELPQQYDLLLIDGPLGVIGRGKFFDNINLFNTNVPMIFDDVHRKPELALIRTYAISESAVRI